MDVEYHIHEIIETAVKFMRHSKRRQLTTSDVSNALKILNIEPLYGYDNTQPLNYKETMVGAGGQTLYYIDEHEIEFEKLINQQLPKVPRQVNFTAHWLAIEGVQPMVPQNPLPSEIKSLPAAVRGATTSMLGNDILSLGSKNENGESNDSTKHESELLSNGGSSSHTNNSNSNKNQLKRYGNQTFDKTCLVERIEIIF